MYFKLNEDLNRFTERKRFKYSVYSVFSLYLLPQDDKVYGITTSVINTVIPSDSRLKLDKDTINTSKKERRENYKIREVKYIRFKHLLT